jgi:hypothetical protein
MCPHPELNWDQRFRKPLLYPFELWGQAISKPKRDEEWSQWPGLNRRPTVYETVALPLSYIGLTSHSAGFSGLSG